MQEIQEDSFSSDAELDEEADDSSTDVDAKLEQDDVFDAEFLKCYAALKKKDEKIYDKNVKFFEDSDSEADTPSSDKKDANNDSSSQPISTRSKTPKMTLLDHQLAVNHSEIEDSLLPKAKIDLNEPVSKSFYDRELEEIKKSIEKVGEELDSESDDDLLVVKTSDGGGSNKTAKNKLSTILDKIEGQEDEDLQHLKKVWSEPQTLSDEDKFLRDYIINKRYLPKAALDDEKSSSDTDREGDFFSKNIDELSDVDDGEEHKKSKSRSVPHHSDEKDFDKIARIPRNSTKTIRDLVEKQEKKERRLKRLEKERKKKKSLKDADCEDLVGDMPIKFHYRETEANDFGLTAEELLMATDEELEQWVSLKECIAYKSPEEEQMQKQKFDKKRSDLELKKKIFKSVYGDQTLESSDGNQADQSASSKPSGRKKKKKRTRKRKRESLDDGPSPVDEKLDAQGTTNPDLSEHTRTITGDGSDSKRNGKKRRRRMVNKKFSKIGVAPDRLLAYGLSKTKLKKSKIL